VNQTNHDPSGPYDGREQTLVKHFILENYLAKFAHIIGYWADTITYVDCFAGPWNVQSDNLSDSSFSIALKQLRKAKSDLAAHDRSPSLRCFFLERNQEAYQYLQRFAADTTDAHIETRNAALKQSVTDIADFVKRGGASSFSFIFVDPTGWTGLAMDVITPLLRLRPGEVLVNFMTGHILRFAGHPDPAISKTFDRLFGSIDYRSRISNLVGQDREDALVRCYMDAIRETGEFDYVFSTVILNPCKDRTHFHLIYATRHSKGVEEFKRTERKAIPFMEQARDQAQKRLRFTKTGQRELPFGNATMNVGDYCEHLRERYLMMARDDVDGMLTQHGRVRYDDAWAAALQFPLVWDSDIKGWIKEWTREGIVDVEGLKKGQRVPKLREGHSLIRVAKDPGTE